MITKTELNSPLFALQDAMNLKLSWERARLRLMGQAKVAEARLAELPASSHEYAKLEERIRSISREMAANAAASERDTVNAHEKARILAEFIKAGLEHRDDLIARLDATADSGGILQIGYAVWEILRESPAATR
jgi:hypothetical protein